MSIGSRFASKYNPTVDREFPLPEYPRPDFLRDQWQSLNGLWQCVIQPEQADQPKEFPLTILVPFCVESVLSGVQQPLLPGDMIWYRRTFAKPILQKNQRVILHFEAVDYRAEVYLNGQSLGIHEGGYWPFSYDITDVLTFDQAELIVGVSDPSDKGSQERGKQVLQPHGMWYTATSGIWQTVWLETVSTIRLESLDFVPDLDQSGVHATAVVHGGKAEITLTIYYEEAIITTITLVSGTPTFILLPELHPWSPEQPALYNVVAEVRVQSVVTDTVKSYFGIRKIHIEKDSLGFPRIYLNNLPYFQTGVLDQGYFPGSLLTPPTDQAMIDDILTMKRLGFNMLRKHIKIEPKRWYWHCDRLGMLVWQDMPSGGKGWIGPFWGGLLPMFWKIHLKDSQRPIFGRSETEPRNAFEANLEAMFLRLKHHPSIVCWGPFNEGWGQFDAFRIAEKVKKLDPTRLVDHASGWHDQQGGDLYSEHQYFKPIHPSKRSKGRPWVLSEFGGLGLMLPDHSLRPELSFGYRNFTDSATLTEAYEQLIESQILPNIPKGLCASIYTQLSDVEEETNGFLTYDREIVKLDEKVVIRLNDHIKKLL